MALNIPFNTSMLGTISQHDRVIKVFASLHREHPFFSYVLMHFTATATAKESRVSTAAVNKYGDFFYNEKWISTLTIEEIRGVCIHEVFHITRGHFFRIGNRDITIWNIATDCVSNFDVITNGFTLPKFVYIPDRSGVVEVAGKKYNVSEKCAEDFYDELMSNAKHIKLNLQKMAGGSGSGSSGESDGVQDHGGFDYHLPDDKNDKGESTGKEDKGGDASKTQGGVSSKAQEGKWKKIIVEAAISAKARGNLPGYAQEFVDAILEPVIDWRTRIKNFVTNEIPVDYTNRLPGRKFYGTGIWFPKMLRENLEVFISIDCSGSTSAHRVEFASEAVGIVMAYEQVKARLICWDTNVCPDNDIEVDTNTIDKLKKMDLRNISGGTSLTSYAQHCDKMGYRSRLHIILTDGEIEQNPEVPPGNIIFVLTEKGSDSIIKKYGAVCRLTDRER